MVLKIRQDPSERVSYVKKTRIRTKAKTNYTKSQTKIIKICAKKHLSSSFHHMKFDFFEETDHGDRTFFHRHFVFQVSSGFSCHNN